MDSEIKTDFIVVSAPAMPVAAFGASPTSGTAPLAVSFTDSSTGSIDTWSWDFGDGTGSSAQNPMHSYTSAGSYTVSLTVSGPGGMDSEVKTDFIVVTQSSGPQTFLPAADARVNEGSPSSNAGSASELRGRLETGGSYESYLRFDLSALGGSVSSAKLRLFCTDGSPVGGLFFPTSSAWGETTINWSNRPSATGAQIAALGTVATGLWYEVDVTGAIGTPGLESFILRSSSSNSVLYSSREGANPPQLVIQTAP
jgi:PKD repeat protein